MTENSNNLPFPGLFCQLTENVLWNRFSAGLGLSVAFSCRTSIASFNLEHLLSHPLSFVTLAFLRNTVLP